MNCDATTIALKQNVWPVIRLAPISMIAVLGSIHWGADDKNKRRFAVFGSNGKHTIIRELVLGL